MVLNSRALNWPSPQRRVFVLSGSSTPSHQLSASREIRWYVTFILLLIAWGVLAFGAVYTWAFVPLFIGAAVLGTAVWLCRSAGDVPAGLVASLLLLLAAIAIQIWPLHLDVVREISPAADGFLRGYLVGYSSSVQRHALSIDPSATAVALAGAASLSLLLVGLSRTLRLDDVLHLSRGVIVLGTLLAVGGMAQRALWTGRIYGFWTPFESGDPFGPFVNRNHYAGWTLMALPLSIGYLCALVAGSMRRTRVGWRNRLIWLSSAEASETMLVACAVLVMALGVTLTRSRSGLLGLLAAVAISIWVVTKHQMTRSRRAFMTAYLSLMVFAAIGWTGIEKVALRFSQTEAGLGYRLGIWTDTLDMARQFPLAGTGLNTFSSAMTLYQRANLQWHFSAAHNDYLQIIAEGGVLLALPALLVSATIVWRIRSQFRYTKPDDSEYWLRVGAVTGLVAIALQETVDFSLQIPANALLFTVLLAIAARAPDSASRVGGSATSLVDRERP